LTYMPPEGGIDVLRLIPPEIARALREPPRRQGRRQRVFLVLWAAGYEPAHAAALAAGPVDEVERLWIAAGRPGDATLERMSHSRLAPKT